jgi:class 3 adenylate cyclase
MTFEEILDQALAMLQRRGRVTYRALKLQFTLDDDQLEALKDELLYAHPQVVDDAGRGLLWTRTPVAAPPPAIAPAPTQDRAPLFYTPPHLAEQILTSHAALEGERKQVTVLFADLKGSMELLAERDPEEARHLLDPVLDRMMAAVHQYEGTVNQVMGDGIMALFGAPLAHEDHAVRACYAALRLQAAVQQYAAEVQRTHGVPLHIRVGLNAGEVVVRSIGSDLHMDYTAVGQTTHLAARMEQMAMPGSILITPAVLGLVEGLVQVKALGAMPVRGLRDPVEVYEVTGAGVVRSRLQAAAARGLTRFVGRQPELKTLQQALARAERYELSGPLPPLAIPATLHDSLMARLDRLATVKGMAQLGATLGREFTYDLLQAVAPWDEETLRQGLQQLVAAEFLYQQGLPPQATYRFKHALIQEAAYQSLLRSTRQQYHQRIAHVIAERFPATAATQPELLAHHCTEAGLAEQAVEYWQRAGERSDTQSAYMEAVAHLTKGLDVLQTLPDSPTRAPRELTMQPALERALQTAKGLGAPERGQVLARVYELCRQVGDTPQLVAVLGGLASWHRERGAIPMAQEVAEQRLTLAQRQSDEASLMSGRSWDGRRIPSCWPRPMGGRGRWRKGCACWLRCGWRWTTRDSVSWKQRCTGSRESCCCSRPSRTSPRRKLASSKPSPWPAASRPSRGSCGPP